jgi:nucleotide-binding universal stress UspA family protein
MTVEHILVHVEPGAACEARLKYALALAKGFGSRLTALTVTVSPTEIPAAMIGDAQLFNAAIEAADESVAFARKQFEPLMSSTDVVTQWRNGDGNPVEVVSAEAGRADLLILGGRNRDALDGGFYTLDATDVVMTCGRPVIVLPENATGQFSMKRIVLGWKNTRESARAVHDALPFLKKADEVLLTEVTSSGSPNRHYEIPIGDMADHLRAHGVNLTVHQLRDSARGAGDILVEFAGERAADLIVAGAYGHSRMREWALGGVTATLLQNVGIPCLLSH